MDLFVNEAEAFALHMANGGVNREKDPNFWDRVFSASCEGYLEAVAWQAKMPEVCKQFSDNIKATLFGFDDSIGGDPRDQFTHLVTRRMIYLSVRDYQSMRRSLEVT